MRTISLAMIARNEEAVISRCLESVKGIFDEIIVVDTGSTDKTKEIVNQYTDKIYDFKWIDDFSAARNYSFDKCTGDFIFWLDCDDIILPEDAQKINDLDFTDKEIIICPYEYFHDEFGNSICTVPRERIIKRSLGLRWEQPIHEYIPLNGKQFVSDIHVHHHRKHGTSERNLKLLEKIVKKNPKDSRNIYYLGKEYLDFGKIDAGLKYLLMFVERGDGFWEDIVHALYRIGMIYREKQDEKHFKEYMFKALAIDEYRAEVYYQLGNHYETLQQWDKAIFWYEICTRIRRPCSRLSTYQPEYYTWLPCLQLVVCYSNIGNMEKSYEYNRRVLEYRPQDSRALHNEIILKESLSKKIFWKEGEGKKLNLGCGGKKMPGYVNVDIFHGPGVDEVFDLYEIPYLDGTIGGINSEHSIEHVGWQKSERALKEWYRVLKPGGELLLKLPEFEDCCRKYIETSPEDRVRKQWYKYTIYGIQRSQGGEPDEAQTHLCGYSQKEIEDKLKEIGFILDYSVKYNGWDTPSQAIRALKPVSTLKIGWISPISWDAAQTRIRVLNINRWLRSRGYQSDIVDYTDIINKNYDIAIVGKTIDENHYKNIKMLKQHNKSVYADVCENLMEFPWFKEILSLCDKVICCSTKLAEVVSSVNPNTLVIEDSWEC